MSKLLVVLVLLALGVEPCEDSLAQSAVGPEAIVARSQRAFLYSGSDMKARILMTLTPKSGQKRIRELTMLRRNGTRDWEQKYFIYFHQPADVKGMTLLVAKYPGRDDDRWLFIPAVNLVKRIAARDASQSFVGSDFTYEHVSGRDVDADAYKLLREEKAGDRDCYVIEGTARSPAEYKRKLSWIDRSTYLPIKEEYYDSKDELFKVFTADEIRDVGGFPTVVRRTMSNAKSGHRTEVFFAAVAYDLGIGVDLFTERYLREPPRRWVQ